MKQKVNIRWMILQTKARARRIADNADEFQFTVMTRRGHDEQ